jgi:uncharacterized protein (TIGR03790 family)
MSCAVFATLLAAAWLFSFPEAKAESTNEGDQVLVVYNTRVRESRGIAEHYADVRHVPARQVLGLDMPDREEIRREEFREEVQKPLSKAIKQLGLMSYLDEVDGSTEIPAVQFRRTARASIRYLVLCYGVPVAIENDPDIHEIGAERLPPELRVNCAAVDSELAALPVFGPFTPVSGFLKNPLFNCTNALAMNPTNGVLMVTRLDGPSAAVAMGLVDKALEAESNGLWGRTYFDMRGLTNGDRYKAGDDWIRNASIVSSNAGFETIVDNSYSAFPPAFPMSQIALYAGWYEEDACGPFARNTVEFMPGAVAFHIHSFSASPLRSTTRRWAGPLLNRGATATMGTVHEPYLMFMPDLGVFFDRFVLRGFNFGQAACAAQYCLSWQTTVVGDPLYNPFLKTPEEAFNQLKKNNSKLLEWFYVRAVNINGMKGVPARKLIELLEVSEVAATSAVVQEKLADLYQQDGNPEKSFHALQTALKLDPTPQQRIRLMLAVGRGQIARGDDQGAYETFRDFLGRFPDYEDMISIYESLSNLAQKLHLAEESKEYSRMLEKLRGPPPPAK